MICLLFRVRAASKSDMRYLIAIGLLLVLLGGLGAIKYKQISGLIQSGKQMEEQGPPPEPVGTTVARQDSWEETLAAVGNVVAAQGVAVSNESPGVVTAIRFESGALVRAGQVLVELDTSVEKAQLASAQARKTLASVSAGRSRQLVVRSAISKAQLDGDEAQLSTSRADLEALQAQIARKTVRAPFSGRLGLRAVNLGQYLNPGTTITTLEALRTVYVDFTLPQQVLAKVALKMPVRASIAGVSEAQLTGEVAAIDPSIDVVSRTIKLRASVPNERELLRPGMFVQVAVVLPQRSSVITAPVTAVLHAPYGDSVFVVEDKKPKDGASAGAQAGKVARQQFVRLGPARGDFVALLDGVTAGQELVTSGAFKLRNGVSVVVSNQIKPAASLTPTPGNR